MPNYRHKTRIIWLLELLYGYEYKPQSVAKAMEEAFFFCGSPTKGGSVERARRLLTQAKKVGYVESDGNGTWFLTKEGEDRYNLKDNRPMHGKSSGYIKNF